MPVYVAKIPDTDKWLLYASSPKAQKRLHSIARVRLNREIEKKSYRISEEEKDLVIEKSGVIESQQEIDLAAFKKKRKPREPKSWGPINDYRKELMERAKELHELVSILVNPYRDAVRNINAFIARVETEVQRLDTAAANEKEEAGYKPGARSRLKKTIEATKTNPDTKVKIGGKNSRGVGRGRGERHCGICGEAGHRKETCPKRER